MKGESELRDNIIKYLSEWFVCDKEVWSDNRDGRIDIVAIHKSDINKEHPFGIEVKIGTKKTGKDIGAWLKQAHGYTNMIFPPYGKLIILTCPQVSGRYLEEGWEMTKHDVKRSGFYYCQHNVNTFLGSFGIGELQKYDNKYSRMVWKGVKFWDSINDNFRIEEIKRIWKM